MVSLAKSGALIISFCHSTGALISAKFLRTAESSTFHIPRRSLFTTGIVTALALPRIAHSQTTCDASTSPIGTSSTQRTMASSVTGYLNAANAAALDEELMSSPGFSLEQLMELAGLSVAEAVYQVLPPKTESRPKMLLICGPGNNGGDGLVAARHLVFFGCDCTIVYPKQSSKQHFVNLVQQCKDVDIDILDEIPSDLNSYDGIVDAIFGFSFKGEPREPFKTALYQMIEAQKGGVPVISVDVPSGWNVDEGDVSGTGFVPEVLVSLTTPKDCSKSFTGRHFVGGRFLPPKLAEKYNVQMPPYPGVSQVMEVTNLPGESTSAMGWEAQYAAYLEEKAFQERTNKINTYTDNSFSKAPKEQSSWEQQYADYCAEKEARLAEEDAKQIRNMKQES